jgi:hypothetical protein
MTFGAQNLFVKSFKQIALTQPPCLAIDRQGMPKQIGQPFDTGLSIRRRVGIERRNDAIRRPSEMCQCLSKQGGLVEQQGPWQPEVDVEGKALLDGGWLDVGHEQDRNGWGEREPGKRKQFGVQAGLIDEDNIAGVHLGEKPGVFGPVGDACLPALEARLLKEGEESGGGLGGNEEDGVQLTAIHGESVLRGTSLFESLRRRDHG